MQEQEGIYLYRLREKHHLSLDEAASKLGIHRSTLWRYEQGLIHVMPLTLRNKVCSLYGISEHQYEMRDLEDNRRIAEWSTVLLPDEEFHRFYRTLSVSDKTRIQLLSGAIKLARADGT